MLLKSLYADSLIRASGVSLGPCCELLPGDAHAIELSALSCEPQQKDNRSGIFAVEAQAAPRVRLEEKQSLQHLPATRIIEYRT